MIFTAAVEGPSDEAILKKIVEFAGNELGVVHGRNGKSHLLKNLAGYNYAARFSPWIVLLDLDAEDCAVAARQTWLPHPSPLMCMRIAVREIESWLLADADRFSSYFAVSRDLIPLDPDGLNDPKLELINIVRRSRRSAVRGDIVPDDELGQSIGSAYTARIFDFVGSEHGWRVDAAAAVSPSLRRTLDAVIELGSRPAS